jgi:2'-5' RNA ligase
VLRSIPPHSAHVTYTFCATAPDDCLDVIVVAVRRATASRQPVRMGLGRPVIVPAVSHPRLVTIPVVGGESEVKRLSGDVAEAVQVALPALVWSPSRDPHVTLARFRRPVKRRDAQAVLQSLQTLPEHERDDCIRAVHVIVSELTPRGPVYRVSGEVTIPEG